MIAANMNTMVCISILSAALATGACKKSDTTDKAASDVKSAQKDVVSERKDFTKEATDKNATAKGLDKAEGELAAAKTDLVAARDKYAITVNDRLAKIDIKIHELELRADARSKDATVALRARRAVLATKLGTLKDRIASGWDDFTKDVDTTFDKIEKDLNDATK